MLARDSKTKVEEKEIQFKNNLIISNPELYQQVYGDELRDPDDPNFEVDEIIPESEEDVMKMLSELKREGVIS
jgi:hypothetical protein